MGKLTQKILGKVNGAVGDITFSEWNGQTVIKAKSEGSKSAPTPSQILVRERFKEMTKLSNAFSQVIPLGFESNEITAYNQFRKVNNPFITGTVGAFSTDYPKICLSQGKLESLNSLAASVAGQAITVNWVFGNYGVGSDNITIVVFNPALNKAIVNSTSIRSGGTGTVTVPTLWTGQQAYVYIFSSNVNYKSASQFAGGVTVG